MTDQIELLSVRRSSEILGLGNTLIYQLIRSGELRSCTVGRRRLIPREAIDEFLERLQREGSLASVGDGPARDRS